VTPKYPSLLLEERIELIIRESVNKSKNIEHYVRILTEKIHILVINETIYGKHYNCNSKETD